MSPNRRNLSIILSVIAVLLFCFEITNAQICSVNAGVDKIICITQQPLVLHGSVGSSQSTPPVYSWTKLSGPAASISSPTTLTTNVTGLTPGNYVFQLSNKCIDGLYAKDIIAITVLPDAPTALAGPDTAFCFNAPVHLSANAVSGPFNGTWTATPAIGTFFPNANDPQAIYSGPVRAGIMKFTWTISNRVCQKSDIMQVTFSEPAITVSAGPDTSLYCKGKCLSMRGSYPGYQPQHGLWTMISGPNQPTFANPSDPATKLCNLIPGIYRFRWSVTGPCINDSDEVVVNVINIKDPPNSLGNLVYANFCESPAVTSEVLVGAPLSPGDTVSWTQLSGGSIATFAPDTHQATVTVGNLTGPFPYKFNYTQTTSAGCTVTTTHTVYRSQLITELSNPPDQQLPCNVTATTFNISFNKLSTISNSVVKNAVFVSGPMDTGHIELVNSVVSGLIRTDTWSVYNLVVAGTYIYRMEYTNACGTSFEDIAITISRTPGTVNAGSDIILPCHDLTVTPTGSANAPGIYSWSEVSGPGNAVITNANTLAPDLSGLIQGIYTIRLSNWGGNTCPLISDDMKVTVTQLPPLNAIISADTSICAGNYNLSANSPGATETGTWTVSPSPGIAFNPDEHDPHAFVSGLEPNSGYTFTWTVNNVCGSLSAIQHVATGLFVSPPVPDAGDDWCVSEGTTRINLSGNDPSGSGILWTALTPGAAILLPDQQNTDAMLPGNSGTFFFEYALSSPGCGTFKDTVGITVKTNLMVNAGPDMNICADSLPYTLVLNGNLSSRTNHFPATWTQLSGPSVAVIDFPDDPNPTVSNLVTGVYEFEYKIVPETDCQHLADTVLVRIIQAASNALAGPDQSVCDISTRSSVDLSANAPLTGNGYWQVLTGPPGSTAPVFSNPLSPISSISNLLQGTYHLQWTVTNGTGCPSKSDDVNINISAIANAGNNITSCSASTIQLIGSPNTFGIWTFVSGPTGTSLNANSGNTAIVSGLVTIANPSVYTFRYSLPAIGTCGATFDDVIFSNYFLPSIANAGGNKLLCSNDSIVTLVGNDPVVGVGSWIWQSGPNNPLPGNANNLSNDTLLKNIIPGIYQYQYRVSTNAICPASVESIQIIKQAKANAQSDIRICNNSVVNLNAVAPLFGHGTWSYVSGPLPSSSVIFSNIYNPATMVQGLVAGTYKFRWTLDSTGTCPESYDDVQAIIDPPVPLINAGASRSFCQGASVPFGLGTAAIPGVTYAWSPSTMLNSSSGAQPVFQGVNNPGNYVYTLQASIGSCYAFSTVNIDVKPNPFAHIEVLDSSCIAGFIASPPGYGVVNPVYTWDFAGNVNPTAASGQGPHTVTFNNSVAATISLQIISSDGCSNSTSFVLSPYCVLPVKLVSFDATWNKDHTDITWEMENALNFSHFELERSYDGRNFSVLHEVSYVNNKKKYDDEDRSINSFDNSEVYYRLKMLDLDNSFAYSVVKSISFHRNATNQIWPNPFTNKINIAVGSATSPGTVYVKLYNANGAIVLNQQIYVSQESNIISIDNLGMLASGFYTLQIVSNGKIINNYKIIKNIH